MRLSTGGRPKGILLILLSIFVTSTVSQFPGLYDALTGSKSIFIGIKNVVGGILQIDEQHHGCVQRYVCCKFAEDGCEKDEEEEDYDEPNNDLEEGSGDYEDYDGHEDRYDYVKRSWVRIPKRRKVQKRKLKVKKPGSWRWIGDAIVGGLSRVAKGVGFVPSSNRRQGLPPTVMNKVADIALHNWNKIPWHEMVHVMDFATDSTNVMKRNGHVYPYVKSAAIGYGYGHKKHDDHEYGSCTDLLEIECHDGQDGWHHLETHNKYNGGGLSRKVEEKIKEKSLERRRDGITSRNEVVSQSQWNSMHVKDFLAPKVFLCKAGRFFKHLHSNVFEEDDYNGFEPDQFGASDFQHTCDPNDFDEKPDVRAGSETEEADNNSDTGSENGDYEDYGATENEVVDSGQQPDTEVVEVRSHLPAPHHRSETELGSVDEMPLLIFEGLPEKSVDQTEEELVESILEETVEMPKTSVTKAVRLPMISQGGKSLVMVQMDSHEDELTVLEHKSDIRSARSLSLQHVGIRELNYKELWNRVQELTVVKRVVPSKHESMKNEESDTIITAREPKIIKEQWS